MIKLNNPKIQSQFGLTQTYSELPKDLFVFLTSVHIKNEQTLGTGVSRYNYEDFLSTGTHSLPSIPLVDMSAAYETVSCLVGYMEDGGQVMLKMRNFNYFFFVQIPDNWIKRECELLVNELRSKIRWRLGNSTTPKAAIHIEYEITEGKHVYFWTPDPKDQTKTRVWKYLKLKFTSLDIMRQAVNQLKWLKFIREYGPVDNGMLEVHEGDQWTITDQSKLTDGMEFTPMTWIRVRDWKECEDGFHSHCEVELDCLPSNIELVPDRKDYPPYPILSWDTESLSSNFSSFPSPLKKDDVLFCFTSFVKKGKKWMNVCHYFKNGLNEENILELMKKENDGMLRTNKIEYKLIICNDEMELLCKWRDFFTIHCKSIVNITYNGNKHDWNYVAKRWKLLYHYENLKLARTILNQHDSPSNLEEIEELIADDEEDDRIQAMIYQKLNDSDGDDKWDSYLKIQKQNEKLRPPSFLSLSIFINERCSLKVIESSSNQKGDKSIGVIHTPGSVSFDICQYIIDSGEFRDNRLGPVSKIILGQRTKVDLDHVKLWKNYVSSSSSSIEEHVENIIYAFVDAELPSDICDSRAILSSQIGLAQSSKTWLKDIIWAGQTVRIINLLTYIAHRKGHIINVSSTKSLYEDQSAYEGATVIEPLRGFYRHHPVATLDFSSLYPSIMMQHNLSCSTFVKDEKWKNLPDVKYVKKEVSPGVVHTFYNGDQSFLTGILLDLKKYRKEVQKLADDPSLPDNVRSNMDKLQSAIKVIMNSIYGFFGATAAQLPCKEVSETVTAFGREMIDLTRKYVVEDFLTYAFPSDLPPEIRTALDQFIERGNWPTIVYGDTDSVMILWPNLTVGISLYVSRLCSIYITQKFGRFVELALEKCYRPFLLLDKKHYTGEKFVLSKKILDKSPNDWWLEEEKYFSQGKGKLEEKGLETKKKDSWLGKQETLKRCLEDLIIKNDLEQFAKKAIIFSFDIAFRRLEFDKYGKTAQLKKEYKGTPPPHEVVRKKIRERNRHQGSEFTEETPTAGSRVIFFFESPRSSTDTRSISERAESIAYGKFAQLKPDALYYVNDFENSFTRLAKHIFENPQSIFRHARQEVEKLLTKSDSVNQYSTKATLTPFNEEELIEKIYKSLIPKKMITEQERKKPIVTPSLNQFFIPSRISPDADGKCKQPSPPKIVTQVRKNEKRKEELTSSQVTKKKETMKLNSFFIK